MRTDANQAIMEQTVFKVGIIKKVNLLQIPHDDLTHGNTFDNMNRTNNDKHNHNNLVFDLH